VSRRKQIPEKVDPAPEADCIIISLVHHELIASEARVSSERGSVVSHEPEVGTNQVMQVIRLQSNSAW
jgi:hypothetical protein